MLFELALDIYICGKVSKLLPRDLIRAHTAPFDGAAVSDPSLRATWMPSERTSRHTTGFARRAMPTMAKVHPACWLLS